jgi:aminoglycoside phosphotransferase (APT) family kinase protein
VKVAIADGVVRRPAGPWTPAVHALLRHFEQVGFDGAPRVLGVEGRHELLSHIPGEAAGGKPPLADDRVVFEVGALLRRMHDAQAGFVAPADARWQALPSAPGGDDVICHNDVLGQNVVFRDGAPAALIDWELAAPGPRTVDLAGAAAWWAPLRPDADVRRHGLPTTRRPERLRLLLDGYDLDRSARASFLDVVAAVWRSWHEAFRLWGGVERRAGWLDAYDGGRCGYIDTNLQWLAANTAALERGLT